MYGTCFVMLINLFWRILFNRNRNTYTEGILHGHDIHLATMAGYYFSDRFYANSEAFVLAVFA